MVKMRNAAKGEQNVGNLLILGTSEKIAQKKS